MRAKKIADWFSYERRKNLSTKFKKKIKINSVQKESHETIETKKPPNTINLENHQLPLPNMNNTNNHFGFNHINAANLNYFTPTNNLRPVNYNIGPFHNQIHYNFLNYPFNNQTMCSNPNNINIYPNENGFGYPNYPNFPNFPTFGNFTNLNNINNNIHAQNFEIKKEMNSQINIQNSQFFKREEEDKKEEEK